MCPPTEDYPLAHDRTASRDAAAGMAGARDPQPAAGPRLRGRAADRGRRRPRPGWQIPKAVVYRAIGRLLDAGLIVPGGHRARPRPAAHGLQRGGRRPRGRRPLAARAGRARQGDPLDCCSSSPCSTGRARTRPRCLRAQRAVLEPMSRRSSPAARAARGFDSTLLAWRRASAVAALDFLDAIAPARSRAASPAACLPARTDAAWLACLAFGHREEAVRRVVVGGQLPAAAAVDLRSGPSASGSSWETEWPCLAASAARPDGWNSTSRPPGRVTRASSRSPASVSGRWLTRPGGEDRVGRGVGERQRAGVGDEHRRPRRGGRGPGRAAASPA